MEAYRPYQSTRDRRRERQRGSGEIDHCGQSGYRAGPDWSCNVGLLDADIHGPNIPRMMGVAGQPQKGPDGTMMPLHNYGVALMSVGFLAGGTRPVIWRGPLIGKIIKQFLMQVDWGPTRLSYCRSASWHWRRPTDPVSSGALNGWSDCLHTPGCGARGRVARPGNVAHDAVPILGLIRKHELFSLPPLSGQDRHFRSWWGAESR